MSKTIISQALKQARTLAQTGKRRQAIDIYKKILKSDPRNEHAKSALAQLQDVPTGPPAQKSTNTLDDETYATLRRLSSQKKFQAVCQRTEALIEAHRSSPEFWRIYGIALQGVGRADDATQAFQKAIHLAPENDEIKLNFANHLRNLGEIDTALSILQAVVSKRPNWAQAHLLLAATLRTKNQTALALTHYRRAVEIEPKSAVAHNNLGVALVQENQIQSAILHYQEAIKIDPDYLEVRFNLANALNKFDNIDEAITQYREVIHRNPNFTAAWFNLGKLYFANKFFDASVDCFRKSISINGAQPASEKALAHALLERGDTDEAQEIIQNLLKKHSRDPELHFFLGQTYNSQGFISKAVECYERSLKLNPDVIASFAALATKPLGSLSKETVETLKRHQPQITSRLPKAKRLFLTANILKHAGDAENAWANYVEANAIVFSDISAQVEKTLITQNKCLANLKKKSLPRLPLTHGVPTSLFILAPSRSGKTSLEFLLGDSPYVTRMYENKDFTQTIHRVTSKFSLSPTTQLELLPSDAKKDFFRSYISKIRTSHNTLDVLTDTNPGRVMNVWDIADQLPNSYFIFIERDYLDTAVEIFQKHYKDDGNFYAYHPDTIRDHLNWYRNMREILLEHLGRRALKIQYADLVLKPGDQLEKIELLLQTELKLKPSNDHFHRALNSSVRYRKLFSDMVLH